MDLSSVVRHAAQAQQEPSRTQARDQAQGSLLKEDPEVEADKEALGLEREETESSDDLTTQYSIHPPFDFPYFLLLQGYNHRQDFVLYLLGSSSTIFGCYGEHSEGEDEERLKVDILLFAPDILPQHCLVRRPDRTTSQRGCLLRPLHGAPVSRNGVALRGEEQLCCGDLVGLGNHYLFIFKDPSSSPSLPHTLPWLPQLGPPLHGGVASSCQSCGSSLPVRGNRKWTPPCWTGPEGVALSLTYQEGQEGRVLEEVMAMADGGGDDPPLTPAFLLCVLIQNSASSFPLTHLQALLPRLAALIHTCVWDKTKQLAAMQTELPGVDPEQDTSLQDLTPGLRPLVLWMANALELLHFIQLEVPLLLPPQQEEEGVWDSEVLCVRSSCEETMTALEEVIMFTFQQTVYYLTKSMYGALPGFLNGNPFCEQGQLCVPEGVRHVLALLQGALSLLQDLQLHPQLCSQLCSFLLFFINASLFNALMERGSEGGFYRWCRGVQLRANLDVLVDWVQSQSLEDQVLLKLSAAANLLATPRNTLLQASWSFLRSEFPALNAAQLHHLLREYHPDHPHHSDHPDPPNPHHPDPPNPDLLNPHHPDPPNPHRSDPPNPHPPHHSDHPNPPNPHHSGGARCWNPPPQDTPAALRTEDLLESFDDHPPLILPTSSFHLGLAQPITDQALLIQLQRLQECIGRLSTNEKQADVDPEQQVINSTPPDIQFPSSPPPATAPLRGAPADPPAAPQPRGPQGSLSSGAGARAVLTQKLRSLELQSSLPGSGKSPRGMALDPSCLLTPPNTPQGLEQREREGPLERGHMPTFGCSTRTGDDDVFIVELHRGPHGLGLALVDGLKCPLRMCGIYIKSVVPDSPAAGCHRLGPGDRILAVNGISLVGMEYHVGRELIRSSRNTLRLLVAKTEPTTSAPSLPLAPGLTSAPGLTAAPGLTSATRC